MRTRTSGDLIGVLTLVTALQLVEGLSDQRDAEAKRTRIDRKYLLGLELTDQGFEFKALCTFRAPGQPATAPQGPSRPGTRGCSAARMLRGPADREPFQPGHRLSYATLASAQATTPATFESKLKRLRARTDFSQALAAMRAESWRD
ncbi:transposase [Streptomyces chartreusis]|uniref:transposase n=1 Tax=Streptomyces chartreusis TaxID=1969 RepID=UPI00382CAB72